MRKVLPIFRSRLASASANSGRLAVPILVIAALAHRAQFVGTPQFLVLLAFGFLLAAFACAAATLAALALWQKGGTGWAQAIRGFAYGALALAPAAFSLYAFATYPRLADVSTDTANPPALATGRAFSGAALQEQVYPDLVSRRFRIAPGDLHRAALQVAGSSGWAITAELPPGMPDEPTRFQAVATSLILAFRDDIAVRIMPDPVGARFDIRSASRFGEHDLGANAVRIRHFLEDLDAVLIAAYGAIEPVEDDNELPDLPPADPDAPPREDGPPPLPDTKPEAESAVDDSEAGQTGLPQLEELPPELSEIYEGDPPPAAATDTAQ
ncbi:DUF1499 domain-containing protein [Stappia sp.]|uniref:DUF1499 domain-containing protein n=1 Tax=Stappia sp. TaxID=1870903 RepID=UPI003A9A405A